MSWVKDRSKTEFNLGDFDDLDEDAVIDELTEEELAELNAAIDPENTLLPVSERQPNQTEKAPTGKFDRQSLIDHLEEQAKNYKSPEHHVPYTKETRGKAFQPKQAPKKEPEVALPDDLSDVLENATEEEILELAAILGIHGMLSQNQSRYAENVDAGKSLRGSGLKKYKPGVVKASKVKKTDLTAVNELDLEEAMKQLNRNDPDLTTLNLNNHMDVTPDILGDVAKLLKVNTNLEHLHLANTQMLDKVAKLLAASLEKNTTLISLNLESNFLTKDGIMAIMKSMEKNTTLKELKFTNQASMQGSNVEQQVVDSLEKNTTLLRFGMTFETQGPRIKAAQLMVRNNDLVRVERVADQEDEEEDEEQ